MTDKPKFDLSNVGGQPKDWAKREKDYRSEFSEWDDFKFTITPVLLIAIVILCGAGIAYGIFHILR